MRVKKICTAVLISAILMSGCSAIPENSCEKPVFTMDCKLSVVQSEEEIVCHLNRTGPRMMDITVESPEEIQGLRFDWAGDGFSMVYAGISTERGQCMLPEYGFAFLVADVLEVASVGEGLSMTGDCEYSGSVKGERFTLKVDPDTGWITKIDIPSKGVRINLSEHTEKAT